MPSGLDGGLLNLGAPILTVGGAAELIGRSFQATNEEMQRLVESGVVSQVNLDRRNRAFEVHEVVDALCSSAPVSKPRR